MPSECEGAVGNQVAKPSAEGVEMECTMHKVVNQIYVKRPANVSPFSPRGPLKMGERPAGDEGKHNNPKQAEVGGLGPRTVDDAGAGVSLGPDQDGDIVAKALEMAGLTPAEMEGYAAQDAGVSSGVANTDLNNHAEEIWILLFVSY